MTSDRVGGSIASALSNASIARAYTRRSATRRERRMPSDRDAADQITLLRARDTEVVMRIAIAGFLARGRVRDRASDITAAEPPRRA
jgi:hypothetical protein